MLRRRYHFGHDTTIDFRGAYTIRAVDQDESDDVNRRLTDMAAFHWPRDIRYNTAIERLRNDHCEVVYYEKPLAEIRTHMSAYPELNNRYEPLGDARTWVPVDQLIVQICPLLVEGQSDEWSTVWFKNGNSRGITVKMPALDTKCWIGRRALNLKQAADGMGFIDPAYADLAASFRRSRASGMDIRPCHYYVHGSDRDYRIEPPKWQGPSNRCRASLTSVMNLIPVPR